MHALLSAVAQLLMVADRLRNERADTLRGQILVDAQKLGRAITLAADHHGEEPCSQEQNYRARILDLCEPLELIAPGSCAGVRAELGGD